MPATAFDQQTLPTGDGHTLYVAQYGQPDGPAAIVLHGGPGSGTQPSVLDWFDLSRQRVVLYDQRGAGRSAPSGEIQRNDSHYLVDDIERIRTRLGIERWMMVGGSWGATLALLYAARHASRLSGLVLRGSFLASVRELNWFFQSLQAMVPAGWAQMTEGWSTQQQSRVLDTLSQALLHGTDSAARDAALRWSRYEDAVMQAMAGKMGTASSTDSAQSLSDRALAKYRIQAHYLSQGCFTQEAELLEAARTLSALSTVPVILVHGTHDLVCPPQNAVLLQQAMPEAKLHWVPRGTHTPADPAIAQALRDAVMSLLTLQPSQA